MTAPGWAQLLALIGLVGISTPLLGGYLYRVYAFKPAIGDRIFLPMESAIYRVIGVDPEGDQLWSEYAISLLLFSLVGVLSLYGIYRLQGHLPLNPNHDSGVPPGLAFNSAISFVTTTDWTSYVAESTVSTFTQTVGIVGQMFMAAAVGMAVAVALIRGLSRQRSHGLGSFWVDITRSITRVLLPLSILFAIILMSQGVIENFTGNHSMLTVAAHSVGQHTAAFRQSIPGGPVASQDVPELLGNNGGGFFNANLATPFENPTPITNLVLTWLSIMIPFAFPWTFGRMVGSLRQGIAVLASMIILFLAPLAIFWTLEAHGNTQLNRSGVNQRASAQQAGGNMEGKEVRFGDAASALTTTAVTPTTSGAPNSALESYVPLSGGAALANMMLGEVSPGGDGSGLFGKLILALLSVFIAGLMVGRTPEYLGKKIQAAEMKLVVIYLVAVPGTVLVFSAIAISMPSAVHQLSTGGPHGLSELVYAYTSVANGNGSAFAGISANSQWFNITLGVSMMVGRYALIVPVLAIGGSLAVKQRTPTTAGTLRTDGPTFTVLLTAVTALLVGLTFLPVLALGPIAEQLSGHF